MCCSIQKQVLPSNLQKAFSEGQEVSFMSLNYEICMSTFQENLPNAEVFYVRNKKVSKLGYDAKNFEKQKVEKESSENKWMSRKM